MRSETKTFCPASSADPVCEAAPDTVNSALHDPVAAKSVYTLASELKSLIRRDRKSTHHHRNVTTRGDA